jgi:hypothetical protein
LGLCFDSTSTRIAAVKAIVLASFLIIASTLRAIGQADHASTLEQRQPLELVFADSIVPQEYREMMLTTGAWYGRRRPVHDARLTQKIEWGISDRLQISGFLNPLHLVRSYGSMTVGAGDFDLGARYTWVNVGSPFTHIATAMEAGFPSGNPVTGMGEGAYGLSPSILLSREFGRSRYQAFSTTGFEFALARRHLSPGDNIPRHEFFSNSGFGARLGQGWAVAELSVSTNRWSGGDETQVAVTPSYVWRLARRTELLVGVPSGLTSSTDSIGAVVKFTFELGGGEGK